MAGGLIQLVAYGSQDVYLSGTPQITFFKTVHRRHTQFAQECIPVIFQGTANFGQKVSCILPRNGDLIQRMYIAIELPTLDDVDSAWVKNIGHFIISDITIEIGGQIIDKQYGDWLNIWNELTQTAERAAGYDKMIGAHLGRSGGNLYVPLQFWFNKHPGLALPLIALQYHQVKIDVEFRKATDCYVGNATVPEIRNASLYVDYIYLDTDERRKFAKDEHEYLIEQLQYSSEDTHNTTNITSKLTFNHPCKELIWVLQPEARVLAKEWYDYSLDGNGKQTVVDACLRLNGHERFTTMPGEYFNLVQPYQHHTSVPPPGIYVYSFALYPEQHQPSGSVNMSRIDTTSLSLTAPNSGSYILRVYAINYNILRISSGMGGVMFSN